jgi:hypothetical protein
MKNEEEIDEEIILTELDIKRLMNLEKEFFKGYINKEELEIKKKVIYSGYLKKKLFKEDIDELHGLKKVSKFSELWKRLDSQRHIEMNEENEEAKTKKKENEIKNKKTSNIYIKIR